MAGQFQSALKDYIPVHARIEKFYSKYPDGRIITEALEHDIERGFILMRAEVYRNADDALPVATGHAYELKTEGHVQKTSYIECGETSAVGRALAMAGFEVKNGIASREEMEKVERISSQSPTTSRATAPSQSIPQEGEKIAAILLGMKTGTAGPKAKKPGSTYTYMALEAAGKSYKQFFDNSYTLEDLLQSINQPDGAEYPINCQVILEKNDRGFLEPRGYFPLEATPTSSGASEKDIPY